MSQTPGNKDYRSLMQNALLELREMRTKLNDLEQAKTEPIAIVGIGCRLPGADNPDAFWQLLREGKDAIAQVPPNRWNIEAYYDPDPNAPGKMYTRYGGLIQQLEEFDPQFFGIAPREAESLDPQQRLLLEVSWEALENAGIVPQQLAGSLTGVFIGISSNDYSQQLLTRELTDIDAYLATGNSHSVAAGRLSFILGLTGPSLAVDTACSSSLVTVHLACQSLRSRECDLALVGGVNRLLSPEFSINFCKANMLATDGRCKTFDAAADGFVRAEGCGIVVLKRLGDAVADGDNILALIRGSAINQDGHSSGLTVPNGPSQQAVIRQALENGQVDPAQVSYIEAHGTGTSLGDPIEVGALGVVFGKTHSPEQPLLIGSVKTNLGHLEAAAGIAGLIKVVLALQNEEIPPHLHFREPNRYIAWDELPIKVPTQRTPWPSHEKQRLAGVSSFGFSGTNAHVVLEGRRQEAEGRRQEEGKGAGEQGSRGARPLHLLTLSAKSESALSELAQRYETFLASDAEISLADVCFTANTGRSHFQYRLGLVTSSLAEACEQLAAFRKGQETIGVFKGIVDQHPKIAFLFTGQGSQYIDMGKQLYETQSIFRASLDRCDEILQPYLDKPLLEVLYPQLGNRETGEQRSRGAEEQRSREQENKETSRQKSVQPSTFNLQPSTFFDPHLLDKTAYTQPALFALEYALYQLWQSWGIKPDVVIGHSVGEYVAACVAGVFSLEDGLKLIATRARLMQALPQIGEMVAVAASEEQITPILEPYQQQVSLAALNGPENTVISGEKQAITQVLKVLEDQGIKTKKLQVSHAFHSPLMEPMLADFEATTQQIHYSLPKLKLISNLTGTVVTDAITTPHYWCRHLRQPVKFAQGMTTLAQQGCEICLEIGPKPTLLGMGRSILEGRRQEAEGRRQEAEGKRQEAEGRSQPSAFSIQPLLWLPSLRPGQSDWQTLLSSLATLQVKGVKVDWLEFDRDYPRRRFPLPTYPFQRQRYWFKKTQTAPSKRITSACFHPLLGERLNLAKLETIHFENFLSQETLTFLKDHRVFDTVILPMAGYLEMALAAGKIVAQTDQLVVEEVIIQQPLVLSAEEKKTIQLILTSEPNKHYNFEIFSLSATHEQESSSWVLHAQGKISLKNQEPRLVDLEAKQAQDDRALSIDSYYQRFQERGISYGKRFRAIETLWQQQGQALGQIRLPEELIPTVSDYQFHPVLLDACLQVIGATFSEEDQETYLPVGLDRFTTYSHPQHSEFIWSYVELHPLSSSNQQIRTADLHIIAPEGQVIATIEGLQLKKVNPQVLLGKRSETSLQDWLYEIEWRSQELPVKQYFPPDYLLTPDTIGARLATQFTQLIAQPELTSYKEVLPQLESLSIAYVINAFEEMGWKFQQKKRFSTIEIAQQLGIVSQHQRLFNRLLEMLAEEGILCKLDGQWEVRRGGFGNPPVRELVGAGFQTRPYRNQNFASAELTLLERCGSQLAQVLKGECDPIQLLFPEGDLTSATQLYQDSPGARVMNTLVQKAVTSALEQLPKGRKVRILEIGAGTGGTTSHLLPHLSTSQTEYLFTDISPLFTTKAQQKFRDYPFVDYQVLDIEKEPKLQDFGLEQYDIIIAANVLHATQDLRQTLAHVRQLLAPKGMLVLLEGTQPLRWFDLIFGLTEGWWRFTDEDVRPSYPLISVSQWLQLLTESGFDQAVPLAPDAQNLEEFSQQAVIVAKKANFELETKNWLILADKQGIAQLLAEHLRAKSEICTLVFSGDNYQQRSEQEYQVNPANPNDFQQLFATLKDFPHSIVHLWSLDTPEPQKLNLEMLERVTQIGCGSTLNLVQSLIRSLVNPPSLWLVTRGAIATGIETQISGLAQSPLWGLGKVIVLEHPELNCVRIDLDPEASQEEQIQTLLSEIQSNTKEEQIAFRNHVRYVARLVRHTQEVGRGGFPNPPVRESGGAGFQTRPYGSRKSEFLKPYQLTISQRGTLENLQWQPITRRPPETGEVEIRIRATGLNFIDVLDALGLLPFKRDWFGVECAGEIVALGKGVDGLEIGDAVVAIAPGSFSQYVTVNAALVVQKPKTLSFEGSATIPANFLTAYYALHQIAEISQGDKVLIHAAAGGTGMAALQLAQQAGAEVFATASPGKWDALKSLGVKQIMNSRTLDFADEVMAITQGEGVNIVFNSLSGDFIPKSLSVLNNRGRFIEIGKRGVWTTEQVQQIQPNVAYFQVDLMTVAQQQPHLVQSMLTYLMQQFQEGKLQPLPHQVFPLQDVVSAFRTMQQAKHIGKIVISQESGVGSRESVGAGFQTRPYRSQKVEVRPDGSYLITGGLGGLGLLVARQMVERGARNLVLVGRTEANSTAQEQLKELEQLGARIIVAQADVSQKDQLAQVLAEIEQSLAPLRGVIHAAGVLDDGVLRQLNWQRLEKVIAPKVKGAWNLHLLTQDKPLDFFILFSSAASLLGSPGQGNHVAANTFLDTLAHYRQSIGMPGLSINWGAWSDIGAAAKRQVDEQMRIKGVGAIAPAQGLQLLEQLMQQPSAQVGVVPINWSQLLEKGIASPFFADFYQPKQQSEQPSALLQQLKEKREGDRQAFLVAHLQAEVGKVLKLQPSQLPNPKQGFFDIGMDSLMAIELRNRLETSLGVPISSTVIFEYPTIKDLARYIAEEVLPLTLPETKKVEPKTTEEQPMQKEEVEVSIAKELEELEALLGGGKQP